MTEPNPTRHMLQAAVAHLATPDGQRETYLSSNLAKARASIATVCKLARRIDAQAEDVGIALGRGDGSPVRFAEVTAETVRDLRIACADLETFCRLYEEDQ